MKPIPTIANTRVNTHRWVKTEVDSKTVQGDRTEPSPPACDKLSLPVNKPLGLIPALSVNTKTAPDENPSLPQAVMDPRLESITKQLVAAREVALSQTNSPIDGELPVTNETLSALWPERSLNQIHNGSLNYKEPTAQLPLMDRQEFVASLKLKGVPPEIINKLELVEVNYHGFGSETLGGFPTPGLPRKGQLALHKDVAASAATVFERIFEETSFPMTSILPVSQFGWGDATSVKYNNSSGFNWRLVGGSDEVSDHAFGGAIDLNARQNPWVKDESDPRGYDAKIPGTLTAESDVVRIFKEEGWKWGGDWENSKDWQHFYRPEVALENFGKVEVAE